MCYYAYGPYGADAPPLYSSRTAAGGFASVPVNIIEKEDRYELSLYAPALVKERIRVATQGDVLVISYVSPEERTGEGAYSLREYNNISFRRSFLLNDKVAAATISAAYNEGVLKVVLPKKPGVNEPAQDVKMT